VLDATTIARQDAVATQVFAPRRVPLRAPLRLLASLGIIAVVFIVTAWIAGTAPFGGPAYDPYSEIAVHRAIPFDAPLPFDMSVATGGHGTDLPYHAQWTSSLTADDLVAQFHEHLGGSPRWTAVKLQSEPGTETFSLTRVDARGYLTHFARLTITQAHSQAIVTLDFTPLPSSGAPAPR